MRNREVAQLLYEIADLLEMQKEEFKPRAYRRAARNIGSLSEPIEDYHKKGKLQEINGVGESIADKISEYLNTGEMQYYESLKKDLPVDIDSLSAIEGVGPKTARELYEDLGVRTLDDLQDAGEKGEIAKIEGFGEKTQENILKHIEAARTEEQRILLNNAFPIAENIQEKLQSFQDFETVKIVGSFRRKKPTVGDIDILATSNSAEKAIEHFCKMKDVEETINRGKTKSSVLISDKIQVDLRIVEEKFWSSAKIYFTGSKDHNIALRNLAKDKGLKLSEYGLFEEENKVEGQTEQKIYSNLGLEYIPPELREDLGEIEAAKKESLPELIAFGELRGDLQIHTEYSDGIANIREMAEKADKLGHEYILITDHEPSLSVAEGTKTVEQLEKQKKEIRKINKETEVEILQGLEADITEQGLDITDEIIDILDILVVSMHSRPQNPTEQIIQVFEDYPVDIFAHPLNRRINRREPLKIDMDKVVEKAGEENIALEINSQPERLDMPWDLVQQYSDRADFVISTDAHTTEEMDYLHLGISQARKGWLENKDVINTKSLEKVRSYFQ